MNNYLKLAGIISCLMFNSSALAADKDIGDKGFTMEVTVSGFFSPEVEAAIVTAVDENSSAQQQGITIGDKLVAVQSCKIPGCSASSAKKMIQQKPGDVVTLTLEKPDGSQYTANVTLH